MIAREKHEEFRAAVSITRGPFAWGALLACFLALPAQGNAFDAARQKMVEEVLADASATAAYGGTH